MSRGYDTKGNAFRFPTVHLFTGLHVQEKSRQAKLYCRGGLWVVGVMREVSEGGLTEAAVYGGNQLNSIPKFSVTFKLEAWAYEEDRYSSFINTHLLCLRY